ncbi:MAG: hypothetical protein HY481_00525 [Candidatus Vogelbacteria bacterium]|nr:hypothetical protein [Candidatus Vogelbacteria bacterium]
MKNSDFFIVIAALLWFSPLALSGQEPLPRLYFVVPAAAVAPDSKLAVRLLIDSARPINALGFTLYYPPEILKPLEINDRRSIIGVWPERDWPPVPGRLRLAGGLLQPFSGTGGEIIEIVFRATAEGRAELTLTETAVYYADGLGTSAATENGTAQVVVSRGAPLILDGAENGQEALEWQKQGPIQTAHPWRTFWWKLVVLFLAIIMLAVIIKR